VGERLDKSLYKRDNITKKGKREIFLNLEDSVIVRIPDIPKTDQGHNDNLAKVLTFVLKMLKKNKSQLKILRDPELGKSCNLLAKIERNMDNLMASLSLPANNAGEAVQFETGLKANLPEILAALRVARRNSGLTRTTQLKAKSTRTTPEVLRRSINNRFGFEEAGADPWVCTILRYTMSEITSPLCSEFPGEWMHSLRVRNDTKSDIGILHLMGYKPIGISPIKVKKTLMSILVHEKTLIPPRKEKGQTIIGKGTEVERDVIKPLDEKTREQGTTYREYRTAVTSLLPFIDPSGDKSPKDQLSKDPLDPISIHHLNFFKRNPELVDGCDLAFALLSAVGNKQSKTAPSHFEQARNHYIGLSANIGFYDKNGKNYRSYLEIPEDIRNFFEKVFRRNVKAPKDDEEDKPSKSEKGKEKITPPPEVSSEKKVTLQALEDHIRSTMRTYSPHLVEEMKHIQENMKVFMSGPEYAATVAEYPNTPNVEFTRLISGLILGDSLIQDELKTKLGTSEIGDMTAILYKDFDLPKPGPAQGSGW